MLSSRAALAGLAALAATATCAPAAEAQSVIVIVTHAGIPEGAAPMRAAAVEAIAERGVRLVPTPDAEPCEEPGCAAALAGQAGADHTLLLAIRSPTEVALTAVPPEGEPTERTQEVLDSDFASAAAVLIERFLSEAPRTAMGFVMVQSSPPGEAVTIDGVAAGTTPLRRSLPTGTHRVRVGEGGPEQTVEVRSGEETTVSAAEGGSAEEADAQEPSPVATRSVPSPFNWVLGGALAVGGVLALISPLQTLAQDGQCTEMIENVGCLERVHIGVQTGVLVGIGIAALIAAIIVDAAAPIRMDVAVDDQSAQLRLWGRF